jgi:hypothetical protein
VVPINAHDFGLHALWIRLVALLNFRKLWLQTTHFHTRPHCFLIEGPEQKPNGNSEDYENPAVAETQCRAHPKQDSHHDCRKWLHDALQESPIGIRVFEPTAESEKPSPLLGSGVELKGERSVPDWLNSYS